MIGVGELIILISAISLFIGPIERALAQSHVPAPRWSANPIAATVPVETIPFDEHDALTHGVAATAATYETAAAETAAAMHNLSLIRGVGE